MISYFEWQSDLNTVLWLMSRVRPYMEDKKIKAFSYCFL